MLHNLILCGKHNGDFNKVFKYCWDQQLSAVTTDKDITYDSVYEKVWKPAITKCQSLLSRLKDKSVTLEEVEILYKIQNFALQLSVLCKAMHQCYPNLSESLPLPDKWVQQIEAHITLYHEIANNPNCAEAATVILDIRQSLELEGDFKIIEDLAKNVCIYMFNCAHNHPYNYMYKTNTN